MAADWGRVIEPANFIVAYWSANPGYTWTEVSKALEEANDAAEIAPLLQDLQGQPLEGLQGEPEFSGTTPTATLDDFERVFEQLYFDSPLWTPDKLYWWNREVKNWESANAAAENEPVAYYDTGHWVKTVAGTPKFGATQDAADWYDNYADLQAALALTTADDGLLTAAEKQVVRPDELLTADAVLLEEITADLQKVEALLAE